MPPSVLLSWKPWLVSHDCTAAMSDGAAAYLALKAALLSHLPYEALLGSESEARVASAPAWSRSLRSKPKETLLASAGALPVGRARLSQLGRLPLRTCRPEGDAAVAGPAPMTAAAAVPSATTTASRDLMVEALITNAST